MKILNTAFEAEGLPKVDDPEVMENILNGLDFDPTPEPGGSTGFRGSGRAHLPRGGQV